MRVTILILLLSLLRGMLPAQQIYFSNNYEIYSGLNYTGSVLQTTDSGFVSVLSSRTQPNIGYSFLKIDKFGDTVSSKNYLYQSLAFSVGFFSQAFIRIESGAYLACGSAVDTNNNMNGCLIKFTPAGDTVWTRTFGGASSDQLNAVFEDEENNIWLCGSTSSQGNGLSDVWLMKLDAAGSYLWDSVYGTAQNEGAVCGELTLDGGLVIGGARGNNPYIIKVDSVGVLEWQFAYTTYAGYGYISQLPDSGYIVACCRIFSASEVQGCLLKLDSDGSEVWNQYVGFVNAQDGLSAKPLITASGIVVAGSSQPGSGYYRGFMAKTDMNGALLWQRRYEIDPTHHSYLYDIEQTNDNGYILAGSCFIATQDAWLIKVDSMGCEVAGCDAVGIAESENENSIAVYPNPANESVTITWSSGSQDGTYVEIVNSMGQVVDRISFDGMASVQIVTKNYAAGLFHLRLISNGMCISTEKLLIVK